MGWGLGRGGGAFAKFPVNEMISKFSGKGKTSEGAVGRFEQGREGRKQGRIFAIHPRIHIVYYQGS